MKRLLLRLLAAALLLVLALFGFVAFRFHSLSNESYLAPQYAIAPDVAAADVALGHRIYAVRAGCIDCHGPDGSGKLVMDDGAMGTIHSANLTPFGLKDWSDEEMATAIRYGIHKDGRSLRFMPCFDFAGLSKGDVAAVVAYLRSLPPVDRAPPPSSYGPVARALAAFGKMPIMFPAASVDSSQGFVEKPAEGPTAEFGHYLASACIGCHGTDMVGGPIPGGDPSWPPAGNARLGSNPIWTHESFAKMVATGVSPTTGATLRPPMPVALLAQLSPDEVTALWEYLKTLQ